MTTEELYLSLLQFNEDEKFYESYYDASRKRWKLEEFLKNLDYQEILNRRLIITEVDTGYMPSSMSDETYFSPDNKNSIILSKHNRYTPAFRHKHVFFELAYVLCGSCTQKINQDEITLTEGQFCLLAPHVSHSISVFDSSLVLNILIRRGTFENLFYNMLYDGNKIPCFLTSPCFPIQETPISFSTQTETKASGSMYLPCFWNTRKKRIIMKTFSTASL